MDKSKFLLGLLILLYVLFAFFEFSGRTNISYDINTLLVPIITLIYILLVRKKSVLFLLFLVCYSLSDLMGLYTNTTSDEIYNKIYEYDYLYGNILYILAYAFLLINILKSISFKHILREYKIHLFVLIMLNTYLVYVLQEILKPFNGTYNDYNLELVYNIVMLTLLSAALLNYFYRDNKKSLYLFLGSLCIVFSEVIGVAYIYISQRSLLNFLATTLALVAFIFFYKQTGFLNEINQEEKDYLMAE
jgi:hypothetical protein